jgi:tetratricopeptide (TPR) repeat protein
MGALAGSAMVAGGYLAMKKVKRGKALAAIEDLIDRSTDLRVAEDGKGAEAALAEAVRLIDVYFPEPDRDRAAAYRAVARGYGDLGEFGKAREWLGKALDIFREAGADGDEVEGLRIDLLYLSWPSSPAAAALVEADGLVARLRLRRGAESRRELARALNARSMILCSTGEWEKAAGDADEVVRLSRRHDKDPFPLIAYLRNRGDILDCLERGDEALSDLNEALQIAVDLYEVEEAARLADRIHAWYEEHPEAEGEADFWIELAAEFGEEDVADDDLRSICLALAAEVLPAEEGKKVLAELTPMSPSGVAPAFRARALSRLHLEAGEFAEAVKPAEEALAGFDLHLGRIDPVSLAQRLELGDAHLGAGAREAAIAVYERARDLIEASEGPGHPELPGVYLRLIEATFDFEEIGKIVDLCRRGIAALEKSADNSPLGSRLHYYLARAEMEMGRPDEARSLLQKCLELSGPFGDFEGDGAAWFFLASVEQALGDPDRALQSVEMAKQNYQLSVPDDDLVMGDIYARLSSIWAAKGDDKKCRQFAEEAMDAWVRDKDQDRVETEKTVR